MNINTQEILDFGRSHTGRALSLFAVLGIIPGISWHDAAIAAIAISGYAFWARCEDNASPGETGADVAAANIQEIADQAAQALPAIQQAAAPKIQAIMAALPSARTAQPEESPAVAEERIPEVVRPASPASVPPAVVRNKGANAAQ